MKKEAENGRAARWLRENRLSILVLLLAAVLFAILRIWSAPEPAENTGAVYA